MVFQVEVRHRMSQNSIDTVVSASKWSEGISLVVHFQSANPVTSFSWQLKSRWKNLKFNVIALHCGQQRRYTWNSWKLVFNFTFTFEFEVLNFTVKDVNFLTTNLWTFPDVLTPLKYLLWVNVAIFSFTLSKDLNQNASQQISLYSWKWKLSHFSNSSTSIICHLRSWTTYFVDLQPTNNFHLRKY